MALVSIIIPTYNRLRFLKTAVSSVLEQTFSDFELIVVDDGSTDTTYEWLNKIKGPIKILRQENKGVSSARNRGIKEAKGEYIAFLDSDDRWVKSKLSIQTKFMKENPEAVLSHTEEIWFRNGIRHNPKKKHRKETGFIFEQSLKLCSVSISTIMVKKSLFERIGLFDESLPVCEDYDMWLRVTSRYPVFLIDKPLTLKEGGHPDQMSKQFWGMDRFRIQSIYKLLDKENLDDKKQVMAVRELKRKCEIFIAGCKKRKRYNEAEIYTGIMNRYACG